MKDNNRQYFEFNQSDWFIELLQDTSIRSVLPVCAIIWIIILSKLISNTIPIYVVIIIVIVVAILTILTLMFLIKRVLEAIVKQRKIDMKEICKECAKDSVKYEFASFDFYTLDQIVEYEKEMSLDPVPSECLVTIYTSSLETEEADEIIREAVRKNLNSGVRYKIYYLRGIPTEKQKRLYGEENLIAYQKKLNEDMELDLAAEFDFIVFEKSNGERNGYFSLNFSTSIEPRPCSQGFKCDNKCHYENDNLLYKKMREDSASLLLATLARWEEEKGAYNC